MRNAMPNVLVCSLMLLGSLLGMSGLLVRTCRLVNVFFLALPCLLGRLMKLWGISGDGSFWKVQLDVRDLGRHLDFTFGARAGTLPRRVKGATAGVGTVGALQLDFKVKLGLVRGKYIPAGLHAAAALMCLPRRLVPLGLLLLGRRGLV